MKAPTVVFLRKRTPGKKLERKPPSRFSRVRVTEPEIDVESVFRNFSKTGVHKGSSHCEA